MTDKESRRQRMISDPLLPLMIKMAVPTMIGMMVNSIYNLTDTFWIGKLNDSSMTAAIGVVFSWVSLVQAIGFWFGYGSGNAMSRALGSKNGDEAEMLSADGAVLSISVGLILTAISYPLVPWLASFLGGGASPQLLQYTEGYLKIMLLAIPFSLFSTTVYNQLRLCGNGRDAMIGLMVGMVTNMVLDPILILGFQKAVDGAGWATLIGQALSCGYFLIDSKKHGNVPIHLGRINFNGKRLCHILIGGAPNFTRQGVTSLAFVALNQAAAGYGEAVIAALTVSARIASVGYLLMIGFCQGFQPICAMNFGAHQFDRVKKAFYLTVEIGSALTSASAILVAVFAPQLASLLSADPEVVRIAALVLRFQCISFPFLSFYAVSSMYMQNVGKYLCSLLISISRQGIFYFPLLYLMPAVWGEMGLYLLQPMADLVSVGFAAIIIKKYRFPNV